MHCIISCMQRKASRFERRIPKMLRSSPHSPPSAWPMTQWPSSWLPFCPPQRLSAFPSCRPALTRLQKGQKSCTLWKPQASAMHVSGDEKHDWNFPTLYVFVLMSIICPREEKESFFVFYVILNVFCHVLYSLKRNQ